MPNQYKLSNYATTISSDENHRLIVTYHKTQIVKVANDGTITLNLGGWDTVTTRRKMNQASRQFNLGYSVYCKLGVTYVSFGNTVKVLFDTETFNPKGE